nr:hypothetical protein [Candidatus Levybacteria bacterium]
MAKYYLFITFLTVFVIGIFIIAFGFIGNPLEQKAIALDKERLNAFTTIQTEILSYSYTKGLPQNLSQVLYLNPTDSDLKDPETQKLYVYKVISNNSYQLCTTFSTDSSKQDRYTKEALIKANNSYKKGYNCLKYQITTPQANNSYPTRTPTPSSTTFEYYDANLKNTAVEFLSANIRYYATHNAFPWNSVSKGGAGCNSGALPSGLAISSNQFSTCLQVLINDQELKPSFNQTTYTSQVYITATNQNTVFACFRPQSQNQRKDSNTKFNINGTLITNPQSMCEGWGGSTPCYWCAQL